ncbi:uncharacterized protein AB9X84_015767 isoform 1-T1 [Acanthopagrus schlegelii]
MVDHMGSLRGGHYTATVLSEDNTWYKFDNTRVSKVKEQPFAETGPYKSRTVYLLTYRAAESQKSPETNKMNDLRQDDVEPKRSSVESDADDGRKGQIRQNDTDEVQETSDEAVNSQTGGEEGTEVTGTIVLDDKVGSETQPEREPSDREKLREEKDDTAGEPECEKSGSHDKDDESDGETSHIRDMKTYQNCVTASEVEGGNVDVEAQDKLNVNVGEPSKDSCEQHLDGETKTEREEATECQKPVETPSEDQTDEVEEEQGEDIVPAELKGDEDPNRKTDNEETTQMGHGAEDEGQMREDGKEERLQAGGEEGDEEHEETDTSINNHTTVSEVKSSADEETRESEARNIRENSKSEELNETRVGGASVNVVEQPKDSSEQHLDGETKTEKEEERATECQKPVETPSEDQTDEVEEEQGEDIVPAELKGDEEPNRKTDDEETTQMGHGAEDEGQMREDGKEERLQARGEEGDEEHVETDTSINNHTTVSEVKSSADEETRESEARNIRETSKSEELNETRVGGASVNVVEQPKDSSEQHLDEETKTEKEEERGTKKNTCPSFCNIH